MPVDLRLIRPHEFVRRGENGALDRDASLALLVGAVSGINVNRASHILLDLRQAEPGLDLLELHALGERLAAHSSVRGRRVAVLVPASEHAASPALAELVAGARASPARAFAGLDEALAWLAGGG